MRGMFQERRRYVIVFTVCTIIHAGYKKVGQEKRGRGRINLLSIEKRSRERRAEDAIMKS